MQTFFATPATRTVTPGRQNQMARNRRAAISLAPLLLALSACQPANDHHWHGYAEVEARQIAAPVAGKLVQVAVARGEAVESGALLFALEADPEQHQLAAVDARLAQLEAQARDLDTGKRREERRVLQAQIDAADAALRDSEAQWQRAQQLHERALISRAQRDDAEARVMRDRALLRERRAALAAADLPGRDDQRAAAQAAIQSVQAERDSARWRLDQKQQRAPLAGHIYEQYFQPGEWVPAGAPVLALIADGDLHIRFHVDEPSRAALAVGRDVQVSCDGCTPFAARIRYISPQAEYTPPVLYDAKQRARLVYRVEAAIDARTAQHLTAGQPVDVWLP